MSLLGNILWIVLGGGIILFFEYVFAGIALCLTIVGIPFGIQCVKLSYLGLIPFGKEITYSERPSGCLTLFMNILWLIIGGVLIVLTHLVFMILCAITIIGIPFAKQHLKLASLALSPFGKEIHSA